MPNVPKIQVPMKLAHGPRSNRQLGVDATSLHELASLNMITLDPDIYGDVLVARLPGDLRPWADPQRQDQAA